jgi:hypothetical protein
MSLWHNDRRKYRREHKMCTDCGTQLVEAYEYLSCINCKGKSAKRTAKNKPGWRKRNKDAAFNAYGGYKCACVGCNETEELFLTIDYVNNTDGGHKHITGSGQAFYLWLKHNKYPHGYRTLCFNCNCGRQRNNGICPHIDKTNHDSSHPI